jgi:hypothetical protein
VVVPAAAEVSAEAEKVVAGWEVTALEPDLAGLVSAPIAVPDCRTKQEPPAST